MTVVEELNQNLQRLFPDFDGFRPKCASLEMHGEYRRIGIILSEQRVRAALDEGGVPVLEKLALLALNR